MAPALADPPSVALETAAVRAVRDAAAQDAAASPRRNGRRFVRRAAPGLTLADLHERFGPMPAGRFLTDPAPGTATVRDWERANRRGDGLYELIDGTLIRKAVSDLSSWLGGRMFFLVTQFVNNHGLRYTHPADGFFNLPDGLRAPDASFTRLADRPGGLQERGFSDVPPALVVEALSPGNTRREMELKRRIYFAAGVELVWEADPLAQTVIVWTAPDASRELSAEAGDTLSGAPVPPGFAVSLAELFAPPGPATAVPTDS